MPHPGCAEPEERRQRQRAEGDETVGEDHRALAVPAVDVNSDERPQQRLGQHPGDGCESQHLGRACFEAHPEDDRVGHDLAAEDRGQLPAPDDGECFFPTFHDVFCLFRIRV